MANTHRILDGITTLHSQYDILVMGGKNVGKTALIYKFLERPLPEIHESGDELHAKMIDVVSQTQQATSASSISSTYEEITILDASSSGEAYASSKSQQVRNAHTILFVYNLGNRDSFEALEYMMEGVMVMRSDSPPPFVVVALESENTTEYQVSDYEGEELANRFGALEFVEVSIRRVDEVKHAFQVLVNQALQIRNLGKTSGMDEQLFQAHEKEQSLMAEVASSKNPSSVPEVPPTALITNVSSAVASVESPILIGSAPLSNSNSEEEKTSLPGSQRSQPPSPRSSSPVNKRTTSRPAEAPKSKSGCCVIV